MKAAFYFTLCVLLFVAEFLSGDRTSQKGHA